MEKHLLFLSKLLQARNSNIKKLHVHTYMVGDYIAKRTDGGLNIDCHIHQAALSRLEDKLLSLSLAPLVHIEQQDEQCKLFVKRR